MGEMEAFKRLTNPLVLNLQKMELELTCPICLRLFQKPMLLPCNHICCSVCVIASTRNGHDCSVCKEFFRDQDLRPSMYIEAMVNIYKSMSSTINAFLKQGAQVQIVEINTASGESPNSDNINSGEKQIRSMIGHKSGYTNPTALVYRTDTDGKSKHDGNIQSPRIDRTEKAMHNVGLEDHLKQKEPNSPESFSEPKGSDYDSNDLGSEPRTKRSPNEALFKGDLNLESCQAVDDHGREPKKQKLNIANDGYMSTQSINCCAFCHISKATEASGQILHYLDGKQMVESEASHPNILHVHQKCIEWAPQVYFIDDTVMNLEAELVRASKIKCTSCGLKGAALGCYVKSCRRSYHVSCAAEISGCRWDSENFLLLCPVHSANKLPCDRSNGRKKTPSSDNCPLYETNLHMDQALPEKQQCQRLWTTPASVTRDLLLCGSGLSNKEKDILDEFVSLTGVAITSNWNPNITHVIAATDDLGACARTLKLLMAILCGKWVVSIDWLKACTEAGFPVSEEPYEISHDIHGSFDGPRTGRIRAMKKEPKLFAGLTFYFFGHFMPYYKGHLVNLVLAAGGVVLENSEIFPTTYVVYSSDPPQGSDSKDVNEVLTKRKEGAEDFAARTCSRVTTHIWLLDTIASCSLPQDV